MYPDFLSDEIKKLRGNRVLVAPLDWGLGHATRCVPIIKCLLENHKTVLLAGSGTSFAFLKKEFPRLEAICFPSLSVRYSSSDSQTIAMLRQLPSILYRIVKEHVLLKRLVKKYRIQTVISDNRFGLWHKRVECVYITHQIMVKMPPRFRFAERFVCSLHKFIISQYDVCWVPDIAGEENLSGDLSHKYPLPKNAVFVGWLSRFEFHELADESPYKNLILVSGPEPQRTIFEQQMLNKFQHLEEPSLLVRGIPSASESFDCGYVRVVSHLDTKTLQFLLQKTPFVYCRSGYSTLMDLAILHRRAMLFPTPGQTEQEYLAEYVGSKKDSFCR